MPVTLRPITADDAPLLCQIYSSTREAELALVPWTEHEKAAFVQMQFAAQSAHYAQHYPDADFRVIERDGVPVGRLYLNRGARDIRIVDIALLPEARGAGIGTHLLRGVLAEGAESGRVVSIHVEQFNPALRLYERLGFVPVDTHGIYTLMQWSSPVVSSDQPKIAS